MCQYAHWSGHCSLTIIPIRAPKPDLSNIHYQTKSLDICSLTD